MNNNSTWKHECCKAGRISDKIYPCFLTNQSLQEENDKNDKALTTTETIMTIIKISVTIWLEPLLFHTILVTEIINCPLL